jgi:hypothetical protein
MTFRIVYPPDEVNHVFLGEARNIHGTVIPWRFCEPRGGFAEHIAEELADAFSDPPLDAPHGDGDIVVDIEIHPYALPGSQVLRTFVSRRPRPPRSRPRGGRLR